MLQSPQTYVPVCNHRAYILYISEEPHCLYKMKRRGKKIYNPHKEYILFFPDQNPPLMRKHVQEKKRSLYLQVRQDLHINHATKNLSYTAVDPIYCFDRNSLCNTSLAFSGISSGTGDRALRRRLLWSLSAGCCASMDSRACRHLSAGRYLSGRDAC